MSTSDADFQRYLLPPEPEKYGFFKFLRDFLNHSIEPICWTLGVLGVMGLGAVFLVGAFRADAGNREKTKHRVEQQRLAELDQQRHEQELLRSCVAAGGTYVDTAGLGGSCVVAGKAATPLR